MRHPRFRKESQAAVVDLTEPLVTHDQSRKDLPDLVYDDEDDKAIEECLRDNIGTTWHSLGTCKMAPREQKGVVDASLNVYGVTGLKVIDLSIPPTNVAANTANTTYAIGEKGADIIMKELGLA